MSEAEQSFGIYEAKTKLSELIERVEKGEIVLITKHGEPVAQLVPPRESVDLNEISKTLDEIRQLGRESGFNLSTKEITDFINEGRR